jgi:hypothetical protein
MTPHYEHLLFLNKCFFDFMFHFVCDVWQNQAMCCIKFHVKLSKSATKTLQMLHEAFGEHSLSRTAVFEWHSRFKASRVSTEDDERSEQPTTIMTENVQKIPELVHKDCP